MTKAELIEKVAITLKHREFSKAAVNEVCDAPFR